MIALLVLLFVKIDLAIKGLDEFFEKDKFQAPENITYD